MTSPSRLLMANSRKVLLLVSLGSISVVYLVFLLFSCKEEARLLEESSASLKQNQDKLAAQLQVAYEQKSRLQKQLDTGLKNLKTAKDDFNTFRSKARLAQEKLKDEATKRYEALKQSYDILKNEFDDLTEEHSKLVEANKMTMNECDKEQEDHSKAMKKIREAKKEDQIKCTQELKSRTHDIQETQSRRLALEASNVELKASLEQSKNDISRLRQELSSKVKQSNPQPNEINLQKPSNDSKVLINPRSIADVAVTVSKKLHPVAAPVIERVNTGENAMQHNLEVPSLPSKQLSNDKPSFNQQIARPIAGASVDTDSNMKIFRKGPSLNNMGKNKSDNKSNNVIPRDQKNLQIAHPWRSLNPPHDSGFKIVGGAPLNHAVLVQPNLGGNSNNVNKHIPNVNNNNMGVIVEPNLGGEYRKSQPHVLPMEAHRHQIVEPGRFGGKVIQSPDRSRLSNLNVFQRHIVQPQVDNPLNVVANPDLLHQPQLQLNPPEGDFPQHMVKNGRPGEGNDDDEDHAAFGDDKDYGAGAMDRLDAGVALNGEDHVAVAQAPPDWDQGKLDRLNAAYGRKRML